MSGTIRLYGTPAEIGEIINGTGPGHTTDREITVFKSVGNAVQDLAVARHVVSVAVERRLGTRAAL